MIHDDIAREHRAEHARGAGGDDPLTVAYDALDSARAAIGAMAGHRLIAVLAAQGIGANLDADAIGHVIATVRLLEQRNLPRREPGATLPPQGIDVSAYPQRIEYAPNPGDGDRYDLAPAATFTPNGTPGPTAQDGQPS